MAAFLRKLRKFFKRQREEPEDEDSKESHHQKVVAEKKSNVVFHTGTEYHVEQHSMPNQALTCGHRQNGVAICQTWDFIPRSWGNFQL